MLDLFLIIFSLLLGLIVGSFLNVVIYRHNTGQNIRGRSFCFACRAQLRWFELVPLLSFIFQGGRCRSCQSLMSIQYPLVEITTAIIFGLISWQYNPFRYDSLYFEDFIALVLFWVIASILIIIAVYDLRHKIIPDDFVYTFILLSFLSPFIANFGFGIGEVAALANNVLTGGLFFLFFWGLWRYSDGRWMGFGDAKLVIGMGFLLGLSEGLTALILSFWLGAVVGLTLIATQKLGLNRLFAKNLTIKSELPFAPFLVFSALLVFIFQINFLPF